MSIRTTGKKHSITTINMPFTQKPTIQDIGRPWVEEMSKELKFILKCHGNTKEVSTLFKYLFTSEFLSL